MRAMLLLLLLPVVAANVHLCELTELQKTIARAGPGDVIQVSFLWVHVSLADHL